MDYKDWKLPKGELGNKQAEYAAVAEWCNENGYHIEDDGMYYKTVQNPPMPAPTIQQQIEALEGRITERNIRSALLGDSYAKHKIEVIESQIAELRKQLEGGAQ